MENLMPTGNSPGQGASTGATPKGSWEGRDGRRAGRQENGPQPSFPGLQSGRPEEARGQSSSAWSMG
jgi:hypothetical protein